MVFPADVLVEEGGQIPGVVILCELIENEVIRKGLHIHPILVTVNPVIIVKGIQRLLKVGEVLFYGIRHLLGQGTGSRVLDIDIQMIPSADAVGVVGKVVDVFQVSSASLIQPQDIAGGGTVVDGFRHIDSAVLPVGNGLRHQVKPLIRPVENHLAETNIGGILHHLSCNVVPQVVADQALVQIGAVKCPLIVGVHPHDFVVGIGPIIICKAEKIVVLIKIAGRTPSDTDQPRTLQVRRV